MKKTIIITISTLAIIITGFFLGRLTNDNSAPFLNEDEEIIDGKRLNDNSKEYFQNEVEFEEVGDSNSESQGNQEIEEDNAINKSQFDKETGEDSNHDHNNEGSENNDNSDESHESKENDGEY